MKLVVKDRYSVSVDDYRRKTVVSNNINFTQPLADSYPQATTPLSDTDKFLVRQGNNWLEVDKSEVGGGGTNEIAVTLSFRIKLNKDGKFVIPAYYGIHAYDWYATLGITLSEIMVHGFVNGMLIPSGYYLKKIYYQHLNASGDVDMAFTVFKNRRLDCSNFRGKNVDDVLLKQFHIVSAKENKKVTIIDVEKQVFSDGEQLCIVGNSNIVMSGDIYVNNIEMTLIFGYE